MTALRRGVIGAQMLSEMRVGWARGRGRIELQMHNAATAARVYYERLGFCSCRWRDEATGEIISAGGGSMYEPNNAD